MIDVAHATQPLEEGFNKESQRGWNQSYIENLKMFNSESQREAKNVYFISIWVLIFVGLNILKEIYQIYHQVRIIICLCLLTTESSFTEIALLLRIHQHL